ncbi:stromal interaction molecule 2 [Esox lucius]|uniref:stromal interaction molecule 2 n=1 Tax=Esox lucius TaxID=8010 RepID=UPI001476CFB8|nr:stromal interaction molecule 2 [Esox lucius]
MMLLLYPHLLLLLRVGLSEASQGIIQDSGYSHHHNDPTHGINDQKMLFDSTDPCLGMFPPCMSEEDRYSLEALRTIHRKIDDDQDGGIEVEESVEFIIEDMKQQQTNKHSHLHREDQHITIEELWRGWKLSEVHNWTQADVLSWLRDFVELPQYEKNFKDFRVNGNALPRIAANEPAFLSGQLKVLDQRDKQKFNIKALDVVLFGPPTRPPHNYLKDLLLIVSTLMGVGGLWFAQVQNKASKVHISKMMKDLESLQNAEISLRELQEQLERAQEEKRNVAEEKQNLEEKMRDEIMGAQEEAHRLHKLRAGAVSELSRLRYAEEELEQVRGALKRAEKDMMACWSVPETLQLWLQLTYEVEVQYYNVKKHSAELQLATAKEEAEKIKKKRSSLMGTFHVAHSSSLDDVDTKILEAKNALSEVTACLRERLHRWQQIERLCGFPVLRNSGLASLTATLYSDSSWVAVPRLLASSYQSCSTSGSREDLMEDPSASILVQPMKRSPLSRGSSLCRQRRSGHGSSSSSTSISSDPDILIPIRSPLPRFEEEEQNVFNTQWRGDPQEMYGDSDYKTSTMSAEPAGIESPVCKTSREEQEASLVAATKRKPPKNEPDSTSVESTTTRTMYQVRTEASVDHCASTVAGKTSGVSMDDVSLKSSRDEYPGVPFGTHVTKKRSSLSRDMMGLSLDSGSRQMIREGGGQIPLDNNTIWGRTREEMAEAIGTPKRRLSSEEVDFLADSAQRRMAMAKEKLALHLDSTSPQKILREKMEFPVERSLRRISIEEHCEMCSFTHGMNSDRTNCSLDTPTGNTTRNRADVAVEMPKRKTSREEFLGLGGAESSQDHGTHVKVRGRFVQPDLTLSTPWKPPLISDPYTPTHLNELVYDGILEKPCVTFAATSDPPQRIIEDGEMGVNPPIPPPRSNRSMNKLPPEMREGGNPRDKEKSKSSKLKNIFKKRKDHTPERPQDGLNNL